MESTKTWRGFLNTIILAYTDTDSAGTYGDFSLFKESRKSLT